MKFLFNESKMIKICENFRFLNGHFLRLSLLRTRKLLRLPQKRQKPPAPKLPVRRPPLPPRRQRLNLLPLKLKQSQKKLLQPRLQLSSILTFNFNFKWHLNIKTYFVSINICIQYFFILIPNKEHYLSLNILYASSLKSTLWSIHQ